MRNQGVRRRSRVVFVAAVAILGLAASGKAQVEVSAKDGRIDVAQPAAERLSRLLPAGENATAALSSDAAKLFVDLLPDSNRKLCGDLVEAWGPGRNEAILTARLLHLHRSGDNFSALLAYRCAFRSNPHFDPVFDERPALFVRTGTGTSLTLISPYKPEECCDPHSIEFLKALPLNDGQLLELGIQSMSHGDGPDSSSRYELFWIADPAGYLALKIDSRTEYDGYEADTEESHERICEAKVRYENDTRGMLRAIVAETTCTENKVQKPSETARYIWNASAGRFTPASTQAREQTSAGR